MRTAIKVLNGAVLNQNMKSRFFTKKEFESAIYGLTVKTDYQLVAASTGFSPNMLSQYFNPGHLRESILYRAALLLAEWIYLDAARGREMWRRFCSFVERALPESERVSTAQRQMLDSIRKTEDEIAEVKRLASIIPIRQAAQAIVADRYERRRKAA